jgi:hypothetical protein
MSHRHLLLTSSGGLVGAVLLTALCLFIVDQGWVSPLITNATYAIAIFLFLGFFSLAEIPVMLFGIRYIAAGSDPNAPAIALFTNAIYIFFATIYAAPYILLTGEFWGGILLSGLSILRFISTMVFLPYEK